MYITAPNIKNQYAKTFLPSKFTIAHTHITLYPWGKDKDYTLASTAQ